MAFASLAAASYVLIWALLRWKSAGTSEEEKSINLRAMSFLRKRAKWAITLKMHYEIMPIANLPNL
jgi:hypothetical protein